MGHLPIYVRFLDDSPVRHPPGKVLIGFITQYMKYLFQKEVLTPEMKPRP